MNLRVFRADLSMPHHAAALIDLLNEYSLDPMGGGQPLSAYAREHLVAALRERPGTHVVLAFDGGEAIGLAVCFEGFSTFACRPLLNIHDFMVTRSFRGRGIAKLLLGEVESIARRLGCVKLTLEVLERNEKAQAVYRAFGFQGYELDPKQGRALFWEKKLAPNG